MIEASDGRRRARILMMAYACSPWRGSEAGAGWHTAVEAARYCDTWVICEGATFEGEIRRYIHEHGSPRGLRFVYLPEKRWAGPAWRIPGAGYLSYNLWQRRALRLARGLHEEVGFDLVHHVNIIGFREPGYLWKLGVPFVWGPVGGTQNHPWSFLTEADLGGALLEAVRNVANRMQFRLSRKVRRACRAADVIIAANSAGQVDFASFHGVASILMSELGVREVCSGRMQRPLDDHLRILWSGSLITRKALSLLIRALAQLPGDISYELRVVGDGPLRARLERLACRLGVDRNITWLGQLPYSEALQQYSWADVFVFTSLRDTGGMVVPEALAAGLPVVCLDHQGVHDIVTDECGIKIPVTSVREVVVHLCEALVALAHDPSRRDTLGRAGLVRALEYCWSERGRRIAAIYRQVLGDGFPWEPRDADNGE